MAKQGMKRIDRTHTKQKNEQPPVPEIKGRAKRGHVAANPIIAGTEGPSQKVYHDKPFSMKLPVSSAYSVFDSELARDNLENDLTMADLQDL